VAYDLAFWTDPRPIRPEPQQVYDQLQSGGTVDGLGHFDTPAALEALGEKFPGLTPPPTASAGATAWEAPDRSAVFEVSWSPQHLIATARGRYTNDQMNQVIDVCIEVGGGRLYDPQTGERFDGQ
jgi:hypothetical protein